MKKRMLMLFVSIFALTPAVLGSAWGGENRGKSGAKLECELLEGKHIDVKPANQSTAQPDKPNGQTKIF